MDWKYELSDKLYRVVHLRAHGYTVPQIADECCLSPSSVQNYIQEAREEADCKSVVQLCAWYFYKYGCVAKDFAPVTKRIAKFFTLLLLMFTTTQIDCERAFRAARRGRRKDEIEVVDDEKRQRYTA